MKKTKNKQTIDRKILQQSAHAVYEPFVPSLTKFQASVSLLSITTYPLPQPKTTTETKWKPIWSLPTVIDGVFPPCTLKVNSPARDIFSIPHVSYGGGQKKKRSDWFVSAEVVHFK